VGLSSQDSFITKLEYGKMLYDNPRGIGCSSCHGKDGEGALIAKYKHKGKDRELIAPRITNISFDRFNDALNKDHTVMPRYYLTEDEVDAIYHFLKEVNKKKGD